MTTPLRSLLPILAAALLALLAAAAPSLAAPALDGEFDLSGKPERVASGPDGNMWVTISGSSAGNEIARITPAGAVTEFDSNDLTGAIGIVAGPDGKMWVTISTKVARFDPATPQTVDTFAADIVTAQGITVGPDGNLWTASADKVLRITPAGVVSPFTVLSQARGIASAGGLLWIADFGGQEIVSVTTAGSATKHPIGGDVQEVAAGPGGQIAYTNPTPPHNVGRLIAGGSPLTTPVAAGSDPFGIAFGPDQAYWIAQFATDNLGRLTADGQYSTLGGLSAGSGPRYIAAGPGNTLWVALHGNDVNKVARVSGLEPPVGPPTPPVGNRLRIAALKVVPKRFRVAKRPTAVRAQKRKKARKAPAGATIRLRITADASAVRFAVARRVVGRRAGRRCVASKPRLRSRKRCVRFVKVGALQRRDLRAGTHRIAFSGRIGRRALAPGSYRLTAVATPADGTRPYISRRTTFSVVKAGR